ncbi:hypothetical protein PR001_g10331 [Phytophthora rubi]|uniref:Integrase catalytic domain-containing protein n=1 Tax=Phytophthora rubi TaxID=129364 RepID=A0A6A3MPX3_9STRA|nr:hypothetical protein PR001_g10331 [Phytophthora rubi]
MAKPLKYTADGIPKNWDGRDWQTYKWAMKTVFQEKKLTEIVGGSIVKSGLSTAEKKEEFDGKQTQIMRMVGTSVPPDTLHQIRDKTTGTEMWGALCELYEGKANKTVMAHRVRSLRNDLWSTKLSPGGDVNKHLSKMFNLRTELASLQYTVEDIDMVEMLLESVPNQPEFENMKAAIRYNPNFGAFTPSGKHGGNFGGAKDKSSKNDGQQQDAAKDAKKKKKLRKCYICDSTDHLRADCPDREKEHSGGGANATEQKRKPRGNVTIHRDDSEPPQPDHEDEDVGVVTGMLDAMVIDAGVEAEVNDENREVATANIHVSGNRSYYVAFTEDTSQSESIHGVTPALASRIAGVGTVALVIEIDGLQVSVVLDDVFYVPGAEHGLLSPGLAAEQGFQFDYDRDAMNFRVMDEGRTVIVATPQEATWGIFVSHPSNGAIIGPQDRPLCNVTAAKGVASLKLWHERLGHTCPQYLKTMVDRGLVKGMLLTQRQQQGPCDACHVGKQKKKAHRKKLDRGLEQPNQVVYADLLIPSKDNGTRYEAVLIIMDGFSRFVTMHLLTSKASEVINERIKEYILWAERQAGRSKRGVNRIKYLVQQVCTDKGGEFVNDAMAAWYRAHGIEHIRVGPKSSQLNMCERTHQSIVEMTKASMHHAGFPKSLWPEAMRNAVYVKNRVYNKGTQGVPFEMMFGAKPDLHHIRKFGALAYVHVPVSPGRKHHDNAKLGFVLGYAEDVVGCKVYFPEERTAKFVADLRIAEDVVYRDRHEVSVEDADLESLHFKRNENEAECESAGLPPAELEGGENASERCATHDELPSGDFVDNSAACREATQTERSCASSAEVEGITAAIPSEVGTAVADEVSGAGAVRGYGAHVRAGQHTDTTPSLISQDIMQQQYDQNEADVSAQTSSCDKQQRDDEMISFDGDESVAGVCGSVAESLPSEDDDVGESTEVDAEELEAVEDDAINDDEVTVASTIASCDDNGQMELEEIPIRHEIVDASPLHSQQQIGKRTHREETPSEELRVERGAEKQEPKRTRTGLREYHERRRPAYLDDYVANVAQSTARVLDKNGKPIHSRSVQIPKNKREMERSKYREFWMQADLEEIGALRAKGVIMEIPKEDVPEGAKPLNTRWVRSLKTDRQGYVIRFKSRIVAFGNHQRPGVDFVETFAPVARMSSFRMLVALAAVLHLQLYGGDINTAYLNAQLAIRQYLKSIEGFPCEINGHVYVVLKALYGLRQSGREWNSELNRWCLDHGYQRSLTEPCLYYRFEGEVIMLVLVYVDDITVATNCEESKCKLFEELDKAYGLKDQGLLSEYLGIEVEQTSDTVTLRQGKYAREVLETFGYDNAHAVGNPMEANVRLVPLGDDEESDTSFEYRKAIGMLMYLATGTRPDLAYAVGQLNRFVSKPSNKHVAVPDSVMQDGYCDSDWANDPASRKSTTGFVFTLAGGAVSWMSRRQSIVALSTAEAEYVAACEAAMEAVATSNILQEVLPQRSVKLKLGVDNQAAHVLATNPTYSRRTRHIELRWHFVREQVEKGTIDLHKVKGAENPADAFTKPLDKLRLNDLLWLVGVSGAI